MSELCAEDDRSSTSGTPPLVISTSPVKTPSPAKYRQKVHQNMVQDRYEQHKQYWQQKYSDKKELHCQEDWDRSYDLKDDEKEWESYYESKDDQQSTVEPKKSDSEAHLDADVIESKQANVQEAEVPHAVVESKQANVQEAEEPQNKPFQYIDVLQNMYGMQNMDDMQLVDGLMKMDQHDIRKIHHTYMMTLLQEKNYKAERKKQELLQNHNSNRDEQKIQQDQKENGHQKPTVQSHQTILQNQKEHCPPNDVQKQMHHDSQIFLQQKNLHQRRSFSYDHLNKINKPNIVLDESQMLQQQKTDEDVHLKNIIKKHVLTFDEQKPEISQNQTNNSMQQKTHSDLLFGQEHQNQKNNLDYDPNIVLRQNLQFFEQKKTSPNVHQEQNIYYDELYHPHMIQNQIPSHQLTNKENIYQSHDHKIPQSHIGIQMSEEQMLHLQHQEQNIYQSQHTQYQHQQQMLYAHHPENLYQQQYPMHSFYYPHQEQSFYQQYQGPMFRPQNPMLFHPYQFQKLPEHMTVNRMKPEQELFRNRTLNDFYKHQKLLEMQYQEPLPSTSQQETVPKNSKSYYCSVCMLYYSKHTLLQHFKSNMHKARVERVGGQDPANLPIDEHYRENPLNASKESENSNTPRQTKNCTVKRKRPLSDWNGTAKRSSPYEYPKEPAKPTKPREDIIPNLGMQESSQTVHKQEEILSTYGGPYGHQNYHLTKPYAVQNMSNSIDGLSTALNLSVDAQAQRNMHALQNPQMFQNLTMHCPSVDESYNSLSGSRSLPSIPPLNILQNLLSGEPSNAMNLSSTKDLWESKSMPDFLPVTSSTIQNQTIIEEPKTTFSIVTLNSSSENSPVSESEKAEDQESSNSQSSLSGFEAAEFKCVDCKKSFKTKGYMDRHNSLCHSAGEPHKCKICGKGFSRIKVYERHCKTSHNPNKPFKCKICPEQFDYNTELMAHILRHFKEVPYKCLICNEPFTKSDHMVQHLIKHTTVAYKKKQ